MLNLVIQPHLHKTDVRCSAFLSTKLNFKQLKINKMKLEQIVDDLEEQNTLVNEKDN